PRSAPSLTLPQRRREIADPRPSPKAGGKLRILRADNLGAQPSRREVDANRPGAGIDPGATRSRANVRLPLEDQSRAGTHRHWDHTLHKGGVGREGSGKAAALLPSEQIAIHPARDVLVVAGVSRPQVGNPAEA